MFIKGNLFGCPTKVREVILLLSQPSVLKPSQNQSNKVNYQLFVQINQHYASAILSQTNSLVFNLNSAFPTVQPTADSPVQYSSTIQPATVQHLPVTVNFRPFTAIVLSITAPLQLSSLPRRYHLLRRSSLWTTIFNI